MDYDKSFDFITFNQSIIKSLIIMKFYSYRKLFLRGDILKS